MTAGWRHRALVAVVALALPSAAAGQTDAPSSGEDLIATSCAAPPGARAPDPRCGEALDGREPADPSTARQVGRAALAVPRRVTQALFWPVVSTSDVVEHHRVVGWARAILTTDDGAIGVRPDLQYSTSFLPSGGLRFFHRRLPGRGTELMARFRTAGPAVMMGQLGLRGPDWSGLSWTATWNRRNDRLFAGVGPNSADDLARAGSGRARYASNDLRTELRWARRLPWRLVGSVHSGVVRRDYRATGVYGGPSVSDVFGLPPTACEARGLPAGCVDEEQLPGFAAGLRIARIGAALGIDLRGGARDGGGFSLTLGSTLAQGLASDPSRHVSYTAETVAAVGGTDRLFLLRGRAVMVQRLGAAPIPFDELFIPSGQVDMRGFADGRLRGATGLVGSAEYRWYISAYLDATLFVDVGTVAGPRFSGFEADRWFPSFGVGFRYYKPQGAHWETPALDGVQIAYAPESGPRFLLSMAAF